MEALSICLSVERSYKRYTPTLIAQNGRQLLVLFSLVHDLVSYRLFCWLNWLASDVQPTQNSSTQGVLSQKRRPMQKIPARYLVSRHPAAIEWIKQQTSVDQVIEHLDISLIQPGDTVIGTLPVHLAAQVCERGGHYLHLELTIPEGLRGKELSFEDMEKCHPKINLFQVKEL